MEKRPAYSKDRPKLRRYYPFLTYGGLGALLMSVYAYFGADIAKLMAPTTPAITGPNTVTPFACLSVVVMLGIPVLMGLLAARSIGFAVYGGLAGAASFVGYGLVIDVLDLVTMHVSFASEASPAVFLLGCQAIGGFICGALGGLVGRGFYQELPSYQGLWTPPPSQTHGSYEAGGYPGPFVPRGGPYSELPAYGAGYGPNPYVPPQYQSPPMYQPGAANSPSAYPVPGHNQPPEGHERYGMPTTGYAGAPWHETWPRSAEIDQEDTSEGPWQGWHDRRA